MLIFMLFRNALCFYFACFPLCRKILYMLNVNEGVSFQLQHANNSNSLKSDCAPELVGTLQQVVCRHIYSPLEAKKLFLN